MTNEPEYILLDLEDPKFKEFLRSKQDELLKTCEDQWKDVEVDMKFEFNDQIK